VEKFNQPFDKLMQALQAKRTNAAPRQAQTQH